MKTNIGKCLIRVKRSVNGSPEAGEWKRIPTPRDGTTSLEASEGTDIEAKIEGGEIIDTISGSSTYNLTWEEWNMKGENPTFQDSEGIVQGEYAIQVLPDADESCPGFQIDRCTLKSSLVYSVADGQRTTYVAKVLKPAVGNSVKRLNVGGANPTAFSLAIDGETIATNETTERVTIEGTGTAVLTVTGSGLERADAAQLILNTEAGQRVIDLAKDPASTDTTATYTGTVVEGTLTAILLDNINLKQLA